jgi:hypothetical protein
VSSLQTSDCEALKKADVLDVFPLSSPVGLLYNAVGRSWSRNKLVRIV